METDAKKEGDEKKEDGEESSKRKRKRNRSDDDDSEGDCSDSEEEPPAPGNLTKKIEAYSEMFNCYIMTNQQKFELAEYSRTFEVHMYKIKNISSNH